MPSHTPSASEATDLARSSIAGLTTTDADGSAEEHQLVAVKRASVKGSDDEEDVEERPATPDPQVQRPRSVFTKRTKWLVVGLSAFAGLFRWAVSFGLSTVTADR